jgi:dephospho-CoA kinase
LLAVGLTGGIGSGKSTVADLLVDRGAVLIDADRIARQVVEPGGPAFQPLVDHFGESVLTTEGTVDRKALAAVAFSDPEKLAALNAITHPAIGARMAEMRNQQEGTDNVVVLDIPLLKPAHRELLGLEFVVVVDSPTEVAVERLVSLRGFDRKDVNARIAAQISREERLCGADFVIDNSSDLRSLESQVDELWQQLQAAEHHTSSQGDTG